MCLLNLPVFVYVANRLICIYISSPPFDSTLRGTYADSQLAMLLFTKVRKRYKYHSLAVTSIEV
jgi:hypothetical protein